MDISEEWTKKDYPKGFKIGYLLEERKRETKNKMERRRTQRMEECGLRDGDWEDRLHWRLGVERRYHTP
jgi:hypothetical protein